MNYIFYKCFCECGNVFENIMVPKNSFIMTTCIKCESEHCIRVNQFKICEHSIIRSPKLFLMKNNFDELATGIFISEMQNRVLAWAKEKGWCDREVPVPEQCALIHSEISEAMEAWRNYEPQSWTDGSGKPQGIASEYADAVIRIMHYCAINGVSLEKEIKRKMDYNDTREHRHGNKQG